MADWLTHSAGRTAQQGGGAVAGSGLPRLGDMLAFIGGGPWFFDHLAPLGLIGIAFGDDIASRALGNVIPVEMPTDGAGGEEAPHVVDQIGQITVGLPIRRYVSISELGVLPAAQLNDERGLGGVAPSTVSAARDKAEMRRRLEGTPLAWPYFVAHDGDADPATIVETVGLPCIVKPRRGVASKGVKLLTTLDHLQRYVAAAKSKALLEKLIFEKYIDGDEFSIEAFTLEGTTKIYSITQKYNIDAVEFDFGFCNGLAQRYGPVCQEAIDLLFARLEVRTGPTHTEVKIDAHGTVRVIETHTRVAGDFVPEMVRVISGVDLYALTVREACGQLRSLPEPERRPIAAALKYKRYDPGKVVSARGESSLRFRPDILAYSLKSRPGVKLRKAESNFDRTDYVACHAPTLAEAYARCDHYLEYVSVATAS